MWVWRGNAIIATSAIALLFTATPQNTTTTGALSTTTFTVSVAVSTREHHELDSPSVGVKHVVGGIQIDSPAQSLQCTEGLVGAKVRGGDQASTQRKNAPGGAPAWESSSNDTIRSLKQRWGFILSRFLYCRCGTGTLSLHLEGNHPDELAKHQRALSATTSNGLYLQ